MEISVAEFRWELKRLLREGFPQGIVLKELSAAYSKWLDKSIDPSSIIPGSKNWRSVFRANLLLKKTFVVTAGVRPRVKIREGNEECCEELMTVLSMVRYTNLVAKRALWDVESQEESKKKNTAGGSKNDRRYESSLPTTQRSLIKLRDGQEMCFQELRIVLPVMRNSDLRANRNSGIAPNVTVKVVSQRGHRECNKAVKSKHSRGSTGAAALRKVVSTGIGPGFQAVKNAVLPAVSGSESTGPSKQTIAVEPKPSTSKSATIGKERPAYEIVVMASGTFKCSKESSVRNYLVNHINRIHKGVEPFKCQVCNIGFKYSSSLKLHGKNHVVEKQFKCEYCEWTFATDTNRRLHTKAIHLVTEADLGN